MLQCRINRFGVGIGGGVIIAFQCNNSQPSQWFQLLVLLLQPQTQRQCLLIKVLRLGQVILCPRNMPQASQHIGFAVAVVALLGDCQ